MGRPTLTRTGLLLMVSGLLAAGCATIQRLEAMEMAQMLAAAGFHMVPADSAAGQDDLRSRPPHRIVSRTRDSTVEYTYADPDGCRCVYVGGAKEYAEYERVRQETEIARRARESSPSGGAPGGAP